MKKQNRLLALTLALLLALSLTACGAKSNGTAAADAAPMAAGSGQNTMMAMAEDGTAREEALSTDTSTTTAQLPESRKWIVTMYVTAETEDLDAMTASLNETIAGLGGYVEDQNIYNGSAYSSRRYRSASLTVRIPADQADGFVQEVSGYANIVSQEKNLEDVTLQYVDTESRLAALETEEERLLELLAQAETMSDLLEIESRLTDVRYELESAASQLRLYDNQIDYATIYLNIDEVLEYTPVEEPGIWERITDGFADSLKGLGDGIVNLGVWIVVNSPYLVVYGLILAGVWVCIRKLRRRRKNKKQPPTPLQGNYQPPENPQ